MFRINKGFKDKKKKISIKVIDYIGLLWIVGTEVLRRAGGKMVTEDPVDNQLVASVQSFAQYIQTHFTESLDLDGKNNLMPGVSNLTVTNKHWYICACCCTII